MPLKDPKELLCLLNSVIEKLHNADAPIEHATRNEMAEDLGEIYNYVSATSQKPFLVNAMHSMSAHDNRIKKQFAIEREELQIHKQFVENSFEKAEQYLKTIQLGAYAAFFTIWGFMREWLDPQLSIVAVVLMIISATTFVIYEIWKATILALSLKKHASISSYGIEKFVQNRFAKLISEKSSVLSLVKSRATVWIICIVTGFVSLSLLVWQLLCISE